VNLAARISGIAGGDEVVLSDRTRQAAGLLDGIALRERGRQTLRNVAEPVLLFEAGREGQRSRGGLPINPAARGCRLPSTSSQPVLHSVYCTRAGRSQAGESCEPMRSPAARRRNAEAIVRTAATGRSRLGESARAAFAALTNAFLGMEQARPRRARTCAGACSGVAGQLIPGGIAVAPSEIEAEAGRYAAQSAGAVPREHCDAAHREVLTVPLSRDPRVTAARRRRPLRSQRQACNPLSSAHSCRSRLARGRRWRCCA